MSPSIINLGIVGGSGRVYLDCWSLLYIVGEPAPTNIEMGG